MLYYQMALFLNMEGKDHFKVLQQSHQSKLLAIKEEGYYNKVKILCDLNSGCEQCKALNETIFKIDEALEKMPIPKRDCSFFLYNEKYGFCRCSYDVDTDSLIK